MPGNNKKTIERFYLERFLECTKQTYYEIVPGVKPDFVIKHQEESIGVELTEFHSNAKGANNRPRRQIEEEWHLLQKRLMCEVEKHPELRNIRGRLVFKELSLPPRSKQERFIAELIQTSLASIPMQEEEEREVYDFNEDQLLMKKYLSAFELKNVGCVVHWSWNHDFAFVGLSEEELHNVISPKLSRINSYKKPKLSEIWLLIVSGHNLSQTIPARNTLERLNEFSKCNTLLSQSGFSKFFIFLYGADTVFKFDKSCWQTIRA